MKILKENGKFTISKEDREKYFSFADHKLYLLIEHKTNPEFNILKELLVKKTEETKNMQAMGLPFNFRIKLEDKENA